MTTSIGLAADEGKRHGHPDWSHLVGHGPCTKPSDFEREGTCVSCADPVSESDHNLHRKMISALMDNEVPGYEDFMVHMRGGPDNFDHDGVPIHCDFHFLQEMNFAFGSKVDIY